MLCKRSLAGELSLMQTILSMHTQLSNYVQEHHISFWFNKWIGVATLADSFPNLLTVVSNKYSKIFNMIPTAGNWKLEFKRLLNDWKLVGEILLI